VRGVKKSQVIKRDSRRSRKKTAGKGGRTEEGDT